MAMASLMRFACRSPYPSRFNSASLKLYSSALAFRSSAYCDSAACTLILNALRVGVIILVAKSLKRAVSRQLAAKLRNRRLVLESPFFVPFGAGVYSVINIKWGEHIVALCQFIP